MNTCENCKFWNPTGYNRKGECRRHAPKMVVSTLDNNYVPDWWETDKEDWCGEFEKQPAKPDENLPF